MMKKETFAWNQTLRFSWAHIITFVAVIVISFMTFSGMTYLTEGDFLKSGIVTAAVVIILLLVFIGAQLAKATERKFAQIIWIERILFFLSPIVFIIMSFPISHFFSVHNNDSEIVDSFTEAINSSKQIFTDYEDYAQIRIDNYDARLTKVLASSDTTLIKQYGFKPKYLIGQKNNMISALELQLLSENYFNLRKTSYQWIDESSVGATTWNAFLIGNIKDIKRAVSGWVETLEKEFSSHKMSNEEIDGKNQVESFKDASAGYKKFDILLDKVAEAFTKKQFPNLNYFIVAILLYVAMILPYFIQGRNLKSTFTLLRMKSNHFRNEINTNHPTKSVSQSSTNQFDDDYGEF